MWRIPAPETCDAIRNATTTAGTVIKRRNWSTDSIASVPPKSPQDTRADFPKLALVHPLRRLLIAGHELVGVSRPGNREQRQQCDNGQGLHDPTVGSDCGQKCQSLVHFVDQA